MCIFGFQFTKSSKDLASYSVVRNGVTKGVPLYLVPLKMKRDVPDTISPDRSVTSEEVPFVVQRAVPVKANQILVLYI